MGPPVPAVLGIAITRSLQSARRDRGGSLTDGDEPTGFCRHLDTEMTVAKQLDINDIRRSEVLRRMREQRTVRREYPIEPLGGRRIIVRCTSRRDWRDAVQCRRFAVVLQRTVDAR